ncbi:MAG: hypothetical protein NE330_18600 [Lentisphaeraceae bacterium]|nr:hypothetical protein [Lentisphaeraceae bacterium]
MYTKKLGSLSFLATLFLISSIFALEPLGVPDKDDIEYPDDEEPTKEEVVLGKTLFFDTRLSINDQQSCASCHNPELGFSDGLEFSLGTMGKKVGRNTPQIFNLAWNVTFFWDGRSPTLEDQALGPIEAGGEMNMPLTTLIPKLQKVKGYQKLFTAAYGENSINKENVGKAIAAFERTIIVDDTPFDRFMKGDKNALSPDAINGLALFQGKARCIQCHDGANFTDNSFHNIGVKGDDIGRGKFMPENDKSLDGAFKTPGLRNIIYSAPYMHDGSEGTLEDVVRFYNKGGNDVPNKSKLIVPLNLTEKEVMDIVAFMGALNQQLVIERPEIPKE